MKEWVVIRNNKYWTDKIRSRECAIEYILNQIKYELDENNKCAKYKFRKMKKKDYKQYETYSDISINKSTENSDTN